VDRRSRNIFCATEKVLSTPPVLVAPKEKEPLLLYIAATHQVVSTVLVVKRSGEGKAQGVQRPVYFLSEVLSPTKQRYPHYQKLAYSIFTTAQKLRQYFAVHPIIVVNEAPLSNILNNPAATGHVSLWGIELSPLDIMYEKQKAIKSQVLLDFTAEWLELQNTGPPDLSSVWTMYFNGSKRVQGAGAGVVLISPQGDKLKYVLRMSFPQDSNNEAEYEALLHGMKMAKVCASSRLKIFGDSNLVVQQVMNRCDAISDNMTAYKNLYYYLEGTFDGCEVSHISRASNEEADNLANIGSQFLPIPPGVFWEEIIERSIKHSKTSTTGEPSQHPTIGSRAVKPGTGSRVKPEEVMMVKESWMQPFLAYMINKTLPEDTVEGRRIIRRSKGFIVLQGNLYKKSITGILERCVTPQEGQDILKDIHVGVCGYHASNRAIAAKAFCAGFY
jgi:ribonuclease HI